MHFSSVNPFLWIAGVELVLLNIVSFGVINHGYLALMPIQFLILGLWVLIFGDLYSQIKLKTVNGAMALLKMFGGALVTGYLLLIHVCLYSTLTIEQIITNVFYCHKIVYTRS